MQGSAKSDLAISNIYTVREMKPGGIIAKDMKSVMYQKDEFGKLFILNFIRRIRYALLVK